MTIKCQKLSYALIMVIGALLFNSTPTQAQVDGADAINPERVAHACVERIKTLASRCNEANKEDCARCINAIKDLLEAGRDDAAKRLAVHCARRVTRRANACVDEINETCRRCVHLLLRLQAPQLARRVVHACDDATDSVRRTQRGCIARLRALFGDSAPDLGDEG